MDTIPSKCKRTAHLSVQRHIRPIRETEFPENIFRGGKGGSDTLNLELLDFILLYNGQQPWSPSHLHSLLRTC